MPVTQDRLSRLREFGLSEYAARSYLALLDLGIAEARDVSSISKVPQAKIYHVLEQLHDKGLVVILPEFPKKYAPVPFEEYLGRLYEQHTKAAQSIDDQRGELAEMFRVMGDTDVGDRGFFTVIRGRRNVLSKIEEMIAQTQTDLIILGTSGTASRASHMMAELKRARERDVRVRMLAPVDQDTVEKLGPLAPLVELRARELGDEDQSAKVAIVVSDSSRAFLIHFVPDDSNVYSGKDIGVFTDQEAMVAAIQAIVQPHWARSSKYERRRDDILQGRAPEFTRVYTGAQEAREALARSLEAGAREVLVVNGLGAAARTPQEVLAAERQRAKDARWRFLLDLRDQEEVEAWVKVDTDAGALEVRHLRTPALTRQVVIDEREAFYAIGTLEGQAEVVVHTNATAVVQALRDHFQRVWTFGAPLDERRRELEMFPGLQPGDVGIGRLFEIMRDAILVADARDTILLWNPAATTIFAPSRPDVRGLPLTDMIAPHARKAFHERVQRFREKGEPGKDADFFETEAVRAEGEPFPVEVTLSLVRTIDAERYLILVVRDITARKLAQRAELEANQRIQRAYERMTEAFYALDRDWRFVYRNPVTRAMQAARGSKSDAEIDGQVIWKAFPDLAGTKFESELKRAMAEQKPVKFLEHYPRMDRWFEVNAYPSEEGLSVYFLDVTQQRILESTEERLRMIVEHSSNLFYVHTPDNVLTYVSPQSKDFLDCEPEEALRRWTEFATDHPVNQLGIESTERAIRTGKRQPPYELELVGTKGRKIWVEVNEDPVLHEGKTIAIVGALTDITERKRTEEILTNTEERFRRAFVEAPMPMAVADHAGDLVRVNPALCSLLGYREADLLGKPVLSIIRKEQHPACVEETTRLLSGKVASVTTAKDYLHASGEAIPVKVHLSLVRDAAGEPMEILAHVFDYPEARVKLPRAKKL